MLECMAVCDKPGSTLRTEAASMYAHLMHPDHPLPCTVGCLDRYAPPDNEIASSFLECAAERCTEPSESTWVNDTCAPINQRDVIAWHDLPSIVGTWHRPLGNSYDMWSCQTGTFHPPLAKDEHEPSWRPTPEPWMRHWPGKAWRYDFLYTTLPWRYNGSRAVSNHVSEEVFPDGHWAIPGGLHEVKPTFSTRLFMWGAYTFEDWYVVDASTQHLIIHACAYSPGVRHFDAISMVLTRERRISSQQRAAYEAVALAKLGPTHGKLLPVPLEPCPEPK